MFHIILYLNVVAKLCDLFACYSDLFLLWTIFAAHVLYGFLVEYLILLLSWYLMLILCDCLLKKILVQIITLLCLVKVLVYFLELLFYMFKIYYSAHECAKET